MKRELGLLLALFGLVGCAGSGMSNPQGQEREPCYPDGTCNPGLTCRADVCVSGIPDAAGGAPDAFAGTGGAGGSTASEVALGTGGRGADAASGTGGRGADVPFATEVPGNADLGPDRAAGSGTGGAFASGGAADVANGTGGQGGGGTVPDAASVCPKVPPSGSVNFCRGRAQGAMTGWGWVALGALDTVTDPTWEPGGIPSWRTADGLCLSGFIPALPAAPAQTDFDSNWGVEIGVSSSEPTGSPLGQAYATIALTVSGSPASGLRVRVHRKGDPAINTYCANMTSGIAIGLTSFNTRCWDGSGTALTAADVPSIDQLGVWIPSGTSPITVTDLCLTKIVFGRANADAGVSTDPYVWVAIQDTEQMACTTNGPGADIDAVELHDASGVLGVGRIGSAHFTPNPVGNACENAQCTGGNCKYAAISTTYTQADLVARTEGPADATISATTSDTGYLSLNAGALQIQIGDVTGMGPAKALESGDYLKILEVDRGYVTSGAAPTTCSCMPERYTVTLQTATGVNLPLRPIQLDAANATCAALTAASTEGCGTTVFAVL